MNKGYLYVICFILTLGIMPSYSQEIIVPFNSISSYYDEGQLPPPQGMLQWYATDYNSTDWPVGPGQIGYGDDDEATVIDDVETAYFRKAFNLTDLCIYSQLIVSVKMDDGAVIYVNGVEVSRFRMPSGPVDYSTNASSSSDTNELNSVVLNTNSFLIGTNIIAVEIHQRSSASSDFTYDLEVAGVLPTTPCTCIDGMILDVDNDGVCDDYDSCIGPDCQLDLNELSFCSLAEIDEIGSELSGVAFNKDLNRLVLVENDTPEAVELDLNGNYIRTISFDDFDDTEGITYAGNNTYFVTEETEGTIVLITIPPGDSDITISNPGSNSTIELSSTDSNKGLEGIAYDIATDKIYTVQETDPMEVYVIPNAMSALGTTIEPQVAFDVTEQASSYPGDFTDLAGIEFTPFGTLLLLTEEGKHVVEVDPNSGDYISDMSVSEAIQPEGLTLLSEGELIVVGEEREFLEYKKPGGTCNDGDSCTINDVVDNNCLCAGSDEDVDNDGICDGLDSCLNLNNSLIGASCEDNDPCTTGDIWKSDCTCEGQFADEDSDGVCDFEDICPMFDDNLIGTSCDDNQPCTNDDVWLSTCICAGTFLDSDGDTICDELDNCVFIPNVDQTDNDEDGTGDACQSSCTDSIIQLDSLDMLPGLTSASISISTNRVLQSAMSSSYEAGQYVNMMSGFEVKIGATFSARIKSCQ